MSRKRSTRLPATVQKLNQEGIREGRDGREEREGRGKLRRVKDALKSTLSSVTQPVRRLFRGRGEGRGDDGEYENNNQRERHRGSEMYPVSSSSQLGIFGRRVRAEELPGNSEKLHIFCIFHLFVHV